MTTITCRAHCARCGRHFTGTAAFDRHLHHEHGRDPKRGFRTILAVWCDPPSAYGLATESGVCRLSGVAEAIPAEVWGDPKAAARIRAAFAPTARVESAGGDG